MRTLLPFVLVAACAADPDNDGLTNAEERGLGTGIKIADTDRDGLNDGDEVWEHGTDPTVPDTDFDGFEDGEEVEAGTDPNDFYDYPTSRWPDGAARLPEGARGFAVGATLGAFDGVDQNGDTAAIDQFAGHVLWIQLIAGEYCSDCAVEARRAADLRATYADQGLWPIHVIVDDDSRDGRFETDFAATWADRHGLDVPVLADRGQALAVGLSDAGLYDGTVPLTVLVARDFTLVGVFERTEGADQAEAQLPALLAADPPPAR